MLPLIRSRKHLHLATQPKAGYEEKQEGQRAKSVLMTAEHNGYQQV